ncbi:hypothetical protein HK102_006086 [Quaeritorhiza haematococci]|nr:hypothetical protein HK102_006086 [Quaeritorhiza haematococci]
MIPSTSAATAAGGRGAPPPPPPPRQRAGTNPFDDSAFTLGGDQAAFTATNSTDSRPLPLRSHPSNPSSTDNLSRVDPVRAATSGTGTILTAPPLLIPVAVPTIPAQRLGTPPVNPFNPFDLENLDPDLLASSQGNTVGGAGGGVAGAVVGEAGEKGHAAAGGMGAGVLRSPPQPSSIPIPGNSTLGGSKNSNIRRLIDTFDSLLVDTTGEDTNTDNASTSTDAAFLHLGGSPSRLRKPSPPPTTAFETPGSPAKALGNWVTFHEQDESGSSFSSSPQAGQHHQQHKQPAQAGNDWFSLARNSAQTPSSPAPTDLRSLGPRASPPSQPHPSTTLPDGGTTGITNITTGFSQSPPHPPLSGSTAPKSPVSQMKANVQTVDWFVDDTATIKSIPIQQVPKVGSVQQQIQQQMQTLPPQNQNSQSHLQQRQHQTITQTPHQSPPTSGFSSRPGTPKRSHSPSRLGGTNTPGFGANVVPDFSLGASSPTVSASSPAFSTVAAAVHILNAKTSLGDSSPSSMSKSMLSTTAGAGEGSAPGMQPCSGVGSPVISGRAVTAMRSENLNMMSGAGSGVEVTGITSVRDIIKNLNQNSISTTIVASSDLGKASNPAMGLSARMTEMGTVPASAPPTPPARNRIIIGGSPGTGGTPAPINTNTNTTPATPTTARSSTTSNPFADNNFISPAFGSVNEIEDTARAVKGALVYDGNFHAEDSHSSASEGDDEDVTAVKHRRKKNEEKQWLSKSIGGSSLSSSADSGGVLKAVAGGVGRVTAGGTALYHASSTPNILREGTNSSQLRVGSGARGMGSGKVNVLQEGSFGGSVGSTNLSGVLSGGGRLEGGVGAQPTPSPPPRLPPRRNPFADDSETITGSLSVPSSPKLDPTVGSIGSHVKNAQAQSQALQQARPPLPPLPPRPPAPSQGQTSTESSNMPPPLPHRRTPPPLTQLQQNQQSQQQQQYLQNSQHCIFDEIDEAVASWHHGSSSSPPSSSGIGGSINGAVGISSPGIPARTPTVSSAHPPSLSSSFASSSSISTMSATASTFGAASSIPTFAQTATNTISSTSSASTLTTTTKDTSFILDDRFANLRRERPLAPDTSLGVNRRPPIAEQQLGVSSMVASSSPHYQQVQQQTPTVYNKHSIKCLAVGGGVVVTGGSQTLRIFWMPWRVGAGQQGAVGLGGGNGSEPVKVISLGESKAYAVAFVPTPWDLDDDGRYVWVALEKGELICVDVRGTDNGGGVGDIVERRTVHNATVTHILRNGHQVWTLDENGGLKIWAPASPSPLPGSSAGLGSGSNAPITSASSGLTDNYLLGGGGSTTPSTTVPPTPTTTTSSLAPSISLTSTRPRPLRVGTRAYAACAVSDRLWTATGKTIEIYNTTANADNASHFQQRLDVGGFAGSVTTFAVMGRRKFGSGRGGGSGSPTGPRSFVLSGHEDSKIIVWDAFTGERKCVYQPNTYRITALLCVGEQYLWTGNSTGKIFVYDMCGGEEGADEGGRREGLLVDVSEEGPTEGQSQNHQRQQMSSHELHERLWIVKKDFVAYSQTPVTDLVLDQRSALVCGRFWVSSLSEQRTLKVWDGFMERDWIDHQMRLREVEYSGPRLIKILVASWNLDANKPADLDSSGYAEDSQWLNRMIVQQTAGPGGGDAPDIIVVGFQELVDLENTKTAAKQLLKKKTKKKKEPSDNHRVKQWQDRLMRVVRESLPGSSYKILECRQMVGLFQCIFAKENGVEAVAMRIRHVASTTVKTGLGGYHGNKGAIATRFIVDDTSLCFVNCHLAAHQKEISARNNDTATIMKETHFAAPHAVTQAQWASMSEMVFVNGGDGSQIMDHENVFWSGDLNYRIDLPRDQVFDAIEKQNWDLLMEHDQLRRQMFTNPMFVLKDFSELPLYFPPTFKFDPGTNVYDTSEKKRIPAWCDRILSRGRIKQLTYQSFNPCISDHKPVCAFYQVQVKKINSAARETVKLDVIRESEIRNRRLVQKVKENWLADFR